MSYYFFYIILQKNCGKVNLNNSAAKVHTAGECLHSWIIGNFYVKMYYLLKSYVFSFMVILGWGMLKEMMISCWLERRLRAVLMTSLYCTSSALVLRLWSRFKDRTLFRPQLHIPQLHFPPPTTIHIATFLLAASSTSSCQYMPDRSTL